MISLSHMDEYAPAHFNAKTWVDDHVGFQVYMYSREGGGEEKGVAQRL